MELLSSIWHLLSALLVLLMGTAIAYYAGAHFGLKRFRSLGIYGWHTIFCLVYLWYAYLNGADALDYYDDARIGIGEFGLGTDGVIFLTAVLIQWFGLSLLGVFLVFNISGFVGLMAFDGCLRLAVRTKTRNFKRLANLIIFLPSVSFWSSALGKDALSFMAVGLALWAAMALDRRWFLMSVSVLVMVFVRPHIACMMVLACAFSLLLNKNTHFLKKIILSCLVLGATAVMVPFAIDFVGLAGRVNAAELMDYVEQRQSYNQEGGGGIDISTMSLPMQLFTYMFRPFIFDVNSVLSLAAALENLILIYLFVVGVLAIFKRCKSQVGESRVFIFSYVVLTWPLLAMTTANLGIALRQKWMFAPMLIFLLISITETSKKHNC